MRLIKSIDSAVNSEVVHMFIFTVQVSSRTQTQYTFFNLLHCIALMSVIAELHGQHISSFQLTSKVELTAK